MNRRQRGIMLFFLPLTVLIVFLDNILPAAPAVLFVKYAAIVLLLGTALTTGKKYIEQYWLTAAIFCVAIADFYFVLSRAFAPLDPQQQILGAFWFLLAYIVLIITFQKNYRPSLREWLTAVALFAAFIPTFLSLAPVVSNTMYYGACIFALVLLVFTWSAIGTLYRGYFSRRTAQRIALAGSLIFIGDLAVAHAVFNPAFDAGFVAWLSSLIWATYIPAWSLIVVTIAEDQLYR